MSEAAAARAWRWGAALFALFILLALRLPTNAVPILNVDEADFAVESGSLLDGGRPYIDFVEKKPPLIYVLYAAGLSLAGRYNLPGLRLLLIGYVLLSALVLAAIARQLYGEKTALLAAPAYALLVSVGLPMDFHAANAETLFLLPLLVGTYLSLPDKRTAQPGVQTFAAGVFVALGSLVKQQAGMQLPILAVAALSRHQRTRRIVWLVAGFAAAWLVALAWLASVGALAEFRYWTLDINRYYIANGNKLSDGVRLLSATARSLFGFAPLMWMLGFGRAVYELARAGSRRGLVLLWLAGSMVPIALGGRFFPHYFLQLYPPLVLLACAAVRGLWTICAPQPFARALAAALALVLGIYGPAESRMAKLRDPESLSVPHAMPEARALASWVRDHTATEDRVVYWGYGSALYYLSERRPATRFPYVTYLVGAVEGTPAWWSPFRNSRSLEIPRAWELFFEDLQKHPPAMFIDTSKPGYFAFYKFPPRKYPRLQEYLEANYQESEVNGFPVWTRRGPVAKVENP